VRRQTPFEQKHSYNRGPLENPRVDFSVQGCFDSLRHVDDIVESLDSHKLRQG